MRLGLSGFTYGVAKVVATERGCRAQSFIDCQINYELLFREVDELVREFLVRSGLGGKGNEALYHVEGS